MCRKPVFLTLLALILGLTSGSWAATWTGLGDGTSWNDPCNWDTGVPGSSEDVRMDCPPQQGPIIDGDVDCGQIEGPAWDGNEGCLQAMEILSGTINIGGQWRFAEDQADALVNIRGGDITVNGDWRWGDATGGYATVNITGGTVTAPRLKIGDLGGGEITISGGAVVTINGEFDLDGAEPMKLTVDGGTLIAAQFGPNGNGRINLDAGTMECVQYEFGAAVLDINDGVLYVDGDVTAAVDADVAIDLITAYDDDPQGQIHREYDANEGVTTVWATTVYTWARNPSPESPAENLCPDAVVLGWTAGVNADQHDVYVGTDYDDIKNATTSDAAVYKGRQAAATYDASSLMSLQGGVTYYWRIDEVDLGPPEEIVKGKSVWQFGINDGNAFDPDPAHNETAVPLDVTLTWSAGCSAQSHRVFFGTDEDQVSNMVDPCATRTLGNESYSPGTLGYSTFYYWRIDEVGPVAEVWKGSVWKFKSQGAISDVNMTAYYKFDEEDGLVARDSSGYDHHASVIGATDADWEPNNGHFDGCIKFDEDDSYALTVPAPVSGKMSSAVTAAFWINDDPGSTDSVVAFDLGDLGEDGTYKLNALLPDSASDVSFRAGDDTNDLLVWEQAKPSAWRGDWRHFAFVKDEVAGTMKIYFDGFVVDSKTDVAQSLSRMKGSLFHIGAGNDDNGSGHEAKFDDFRFYDRALSDSEIEGLFRGGDVELAWAPRPYDGEVDVARDVVLKWLPGDSAVSHIVYFGTDWDDVNDAVTVSSVYKGTYGPNEYDPCTLDMKTVYYWRIDEVNGPNTWKGNVWRFTVADFLVVDDMESYNAIPGSGNEIYDTWDDGFNNWTGAQIQLEYAAAASVHAGSQSMKFGYSSSLGFYKYSEADANTTGPRPGNLDIGTDWTVLGVKALALFFCGDPTNDATEQMYLVLEDSSANIHVAKYGDMGEDMNDIKTAEWQQWNIPLSDFNDNGVTITDVNKVRIGFGDRDNP
ncbi:MAG: LamG domain-containing protein, partial [Planctomycetota bacterium]